jgi:Chemotaxis response regulator containing a CheY-like receiver domain and a methylesterase domain
LIVDDSAFFARQLKRIIEEDPEFVVVGVANNGEEAIGYMEDEIVDVGYRARIRNHGHSCFLCEIVIRSQFHTTYEPEA